MSSINKFRGIAIVLLAAISGTILLQACNKDKNPPSVSQKSDTRYQLPQGNASFDAAIVDYYNKYNTYILYKFSDVDFNYQFSYNLSTPPVGNSTNYVLGPAVVRGGDSIAIQSALDFMQQYWFAFYPEDFKKKYLPMKILLAGATYTTRYTTATKIYDTPRVNPITIPIEGVDHITLPKIDTAFNTYPLTSKILLKAQLNKMFLKHLMYPPISTMPAVIAQPTDFFKVSDYTVGSLTKANMYRYGYDTVVAGKAPSNYVDLLAFLDTICTKPKSALDAYMLNPSVDVLGLTKRKYDLLVNFFKGYGVDIQAIGDKQN